MADKQYEVIVTNQAIEQLEATKQYYTFNFKSLPEISGADDQVGTAGKARSKKAANSRI